MPPKALKEAQAQNERAGVRARRSRHPCPERSRTCASPSASHAVLVEGGVDGFVDLPWGMGTLDHSRRLVARVTLNEF